MGSMLLLFLIHSILKSNTKKDEEKPEKSQLNDVFKMRMEKMLKICQRYNLTAGYELADDSLLWSIPHKVKQCVHGLIIQVINLISTADLLP